MPGAAAPPGKLSQLAGGQAERPRFCEMQKRGRICFATCVIRRSLPPRRCYYRYAAKDQASLFSVTERMSLLPLALSS